jgi:hypothetical protein
MQWGDDVFVEAGLKVGWEGQLYGEQEDLIQMVWFVAVVNTIPVGDVYDREGVSPPTSQTLVLSGQ